ncbi:hypothetical protein QKU48_gp0881 [Fadolivirus algeromassiliense]|jgi:hypothetical protein|uniref:Uncharacterized protein n=1 Tax=Fadolivirus FV1/VV64 TaxID=3070911 RepID=A0A7D3QWA9_9VIRU|nr:hypothetical protein QKU48_gp0881 [Fadolivirus algeromassiliense]QKF94339.1 hypothetical protein Fadolivirus_1_881 [Fadolivirus FV1/VV64]
MGKTFRVYEHRKPASRRKFVGKKRRVHAKKSLNDLIKSNDDLHGEDFNVHIAFPYCCHECDGFRIHSSMQTKMKGIKRVTMRETGSEDVVCSLSNDGNSIYIETKV